VGIIQNNMLDVKGNFVVSRYFLVASLLRPAEPDFLFNCACREILMFKTVGGSRSQNSGVRRRFGIFNFRLCDLPGGWSSLAGEPRRGLTAG